VNQFGREGTLSPRKFTSPLGGEAHIIVRDGSPNKVTSPLGGEAHINQIVFRLVREGILGL
jgi:hypothetical protein